MSSKLNEGEGGCVHTTTGSMLQAYVQLYPDDEDPHHPSSSLSSSIEDNDTRRRLQMTPPLSYEKTMNMNKEDDGL